MRGRQRRAIAASASRTRRSADRQHSDDKIDAAHNAGDDVQNAGDDAGDVQTQA